MGTDRFVVRTSNGLRGQQERARARGSEVEDGGGGRGKEWGMEARDPPFPPFQPNNFFS